MRLSSLVLKYKRAHGDPKPSLSQLTDTPTETYYKIPPKLFKISPDTATSNAANGSEFDENNREDLNIIINHDDQSNLGDSGFQSILGESGHSFLHKRSNSAMDLGVNVAEEFTCVTDSVKVAQSDNTRHNDNTKSKEKSRRRSLKVRASATMNSLNDTENNGNGHTSTSHDRRNPTQKFKANSPTDTVNSTKKSGRGKKNQRRQRIGPCQRICESLTQYEPGKEMEFYTNIIKQCRVFLQESLLMRDRKRITRIYLKALEKFFRLPGGTEAEFDFQPAKEECSEQLKQPCNQSDSFGLKNIELNCRAFKDNSCHQQKQHQQQRQQLGRSNLPKESYHRETPNYVSYDDGVKIEDSEPSQNSASYSTTVGRDNNIDNETENTESLFKEDNKKELRRIKRDAIETRDQIISLKHLLRDSQNELSANKVKDIKSDIIHLRKELRVLKYNHDFLSPSNKKDRMQPVVNINNDCLNSQENNKAYCNDCQKNNESYCSDHRQKNNEAYCFDCQEVNRTYCSDSSEINEISCCGSSVADPKLQLSDLSQSTTSSTSFFDESISQGLVVSSLDKDLGIKIPSSSRISKSLKTRQDTQQSADPRTSSNMFTTTRPPTDDKEKAQKHFESKTSTSLVEEPINTYFLSSERSISSSSNASNITQIQTTVPANFSVNKKLQTENQLHEIQPSKHVLAKAIRRDLPRSDSSVTTESLNEETVILCIDLMVSLDTYFICY